MTRRKLLQLALLVLLAGAAAWLYVARQGGLPKPVTALLAREARVPASALPPAGAVPAPGPGTRAPTAADSRAGANRAARSRSPGARAVPSHPVEGEIDGERFVLEAAGIESGVLHLRQLEPPLALALVLPVNPWQVPAGRSFEALAPEKRGADTPLVRVRAGAGRTRVYPERYTLWLEFGRERNGTLPGRLHLVLPDAAGSRVAGTFVADVRGFRFIDGKPDLSADSIDTFEYLALREILRNDPSLALEDLAFGAGKLVPGRDGAPGSGYLEVGYRVQGKALERAFRFVKEGGRWQVQETAGAGAQGGAETGS